MKFIKFSLISLLLLATIACSSEQGPLPNAVRNAFNKHLPDAKITDWEKEADAYEIEFNVNNTEGEAVFKEDGTMVEIEHEIALDELPKAIHSYVTKNYPDYTLEEAEKITEPEGYLFEVELKKDKMEKEVLFDSQGNFLGEEDDDNEEDDDDDD